MTVVLTSSRIFNTAQRLIKLNLCGKTKQSLKWTILPKILTIDLMKKGYQYPDGRMRLHSLSTKNWAFTLSFSSYLQNNLFQFNDISMGI